MIGCCDSLVVCMVLPRMSTSDALSRPRAFNFLPCYLLRRHNSNKSVDQLCKIIPQKWTSTLFSALATPLAIVCEVRQLTVPFLELVDAGSRSGGMRAGYRIRYPLFATNTSAMNCLLLLRFHLQQSGGYRTDEAASPRFTETIQFALGSEYPP